MRSEGGDDSKGAPSRLEISAIVDAVIFIDPIARFGVESPVNSSSHEAPKV